MSVKCCLITGGGGFIGSHLVKAFVLDGWKVKVLDRFLGITFESSIGKKVEYFKGDFDDRAQLKKILPGVDVLLHLASTTTPAMAYGRSSFDVESNLIGTLNLLEESILHGVSRVIFPSSGGTVYGKVRNVPITEKHPTRPISSHGIIKLAIENYIQMYSHEKGLQYTILRIANPYGPGQRPDASQGAVAVFTGKILRNENIDLWGDGSAVRDFIYIDDLVRAVLSVVNVKDSMNQIINIGGGEGFSIRQVISIIERKTGKGALINYHHARNFDVPANVLSIAKAKSKLAWTPNISFESGIGSTISWLESCLKS